MWVAEDDRVERGIAHVAEFEVAQAEQVAHPRCCKDEAADLGRAEGHRVARQRSRGEMRAAMLVDPAAQGPDEILPVPWGVVRLQQEHGLLLSRRRRELVPGLHDRPEVVLVRLVEIDVSRNLERARRG